MQIEGTVGIRESPIHTARNKGAKLEAGVYVWEKHSPVLEIEQGSQPPRSRNLTEEPARTKIGSDAGRHQKTDQSFAFDQTMPAFHEKGIDVNVATGKQRIIATSLCHLLRFFRLIPRNLIFAPKRIVTFSQRFYHSSSIRGAICVGDLRATGGEPLHFLQLDSIPGRIANYCVEAPLRIGTFPV